MATVIKFHENALRILRARLKRNPKDIHIRMTILILNIQLMDMQDEERRLLREKV